MDKVIIPTTYISPTTCIFICLQQPFKKRAFPKSDPLLDDFMSSALWPEVIGGKIKPIQAGDDPGQDPWSVTML